MRSLALILCLTAPAFAGEYAVLSTGGRLYADRHESDGGKVRLYTGDGFIELKSEHVQNFEAEEARPATPAAPVPAVVPAVEAPAIAHTKAPTLHELADAAADKYRLPRKLVRSVMAAESAFQPNAVSPKGAIGPMQLMPATARELGVDPHDPVQNIDGGARYLRDLLERYDYGLWHALAAYNAGPGAVDKYHGVPPYPDTINYVNKIDRAFRN
jgi:soluble lytic murein transglycosylase-like protein